LLHSRPKRRRQIDSVRMLTGSRTTDAGENRHRRDGFNYASVESVLEDQWMANKRFYQNCPNGQDIVELVTFEL